jgi:hypothetical protein
VNLDWKIGFATKDWDAIAKKEKIEVGRWNMNCSTKPHFCPSVMTHELIFNAVFGVVS